MIIKIVSITCLSAMFAACSNPLGDGPSQVDANYGATRPTKPDSSLGIDTVSGSKSVKPTASGNYTVDVTVGVATTKIKLNSSNNKTVYVSVQGQKISN